MESLSSINTLCSSATHTHPHSSSINTAYDLLSLLLTLSLLLALSSRCLAPPHSFIMPAPVSASDRLSAGAMDAQRKVDTVLAIRARSLDVVQWMSRVMGWSESEAETKGMTVNDKDSEAVVERWFARVANGAVLCQLIDKIKDNSPVISTSSSSSSASLSSHLHRDALPGSFQARDNIDRFIRAAQQMGVSSLVCFDTEDLVLRQNDKKVVNTLMELSRQSALHYNIAPTTLIQYDMEWEQLVIEREKKATAQPNTATVVSQDKEEEEEEESIMTGTPASTAAAGRYEADEKESAASHPQSSSSAASAAELASGDALDQAISRLISARKFSIPIVRVAIKNKKKRRTGKAEYRVGSGPKFTVRLLHGHLIAKRDNDAVGWIDLEDAIQERVTHERLAMITA